MTLYGAFRVSVGLAGCRLSVESDLQQSGDVARRPLRSVTPFTIRCKQTALGHDGKRGAELAFIESGTSQQQDRRGHASESR